MSDTTRIAWTSKTWNPWRGCTRVSAGCARCYMFARLEQLKTMDPATVTRTTTWADPIRWQRQAARDGSRPLVFACSWSDFFHADADGWRDEAWRTIRACPNLTFQIPTKRAERIAGHLPADWGTGYPNVWVGVSVEDNAHVGRVDVLRAIPAAVRFISAEPLLGPLPDLDLTGIAWLIVGGESGTHFRPMDLDWARDLRDRAAADGCAFFFKQSAGKRPGTGTMLDGVMVREWPSGRDVGAGRAQ
jgi:protein gp37